MNDAVNNNKTAIPPNPEVPAGSCEFECKQQESPLRNPMMLPPMQSLGSHFDQASQILCVPNEQPIYHAEWRKEQLSPPSIYPTVSW